MAISDGRNILFVAGVILLIFSIIFRHRRQYFAILLLTLAAFCLFLYASLLDNFLNQWDERFHALVAKNMTDHPFKPRLFEFALPGFNHDVWDREVIWLHKQPLFLWQMSLSIRLFGANELAVRLPSVLLATLMIPLSYHTASVIFNNKSGYYTALLFFSSYFLFELVSGRQGMEHNDVSFLFYISASVWALVSYLKNRKIRWLLLIGIFSGAAILTKWLVGLYVYLFWALYLLFNKEVSRKNIIHLVIAFMTTVVVVLPWQIYIFRVFPEEAYTEFVYNSLHFTDVLEGHGGDYLYYFRNITELYGLMISVLIPLAFVFLFSSSRYRWPILLSIVVVYLFYTLAQTKLPAYPFMLSLLIFAISGYMLYKIETLFQERWKWLFIVPLFLLIYTNFRPHKINKRHNILSENNLYTIRQKENKIALTELRQQLPENSILFNVRGRHYIEAMFYTGHQAYPHFPTTEQLSFIRKKGWKAIILYDQICDVPYHLQKQPDIILYKTKLHFFDT